MRSPLTVIGPAAADLEATRALLLETLARVRAECDPGRVTWLTAEEPHVGEYRNPANVEDLPQGGKSIDQMVIDFQGACMRTRDTSSGRNSGSR